MQVVLVHHAEAVGPDVNPQRPLSTRGREQARWLAEQAKAAGAAPSAIWHSGKLRARETAEPFYRLCNPFAAFTMVRGLRPDDAPAIVHDALLREAADLLLVGHMPNIAGVLESLVPGADRFPLHGAVAVVTDDAGLTWREAWRRSPPAVT